MDNDSNFRIDGFFYAAAELRFTLKVNDFEQLGQLLARLAAVPGVGEAVRLSE